MIQKNDVGLLKIEVLTCSTRMGQSRIVQAGSMEHNQGFE